MQGMGKPGFLARHGMALLLLVAAGCSAWFAAGAVSDLLQRRREDGELRRSARELEVLFADGDERAAEFRDEARRRLDARRAELDSRWAWLRLGGSLGSTLLLAGVAGRLWSRVRPGPRRACPSSRRTDPGPPP